MTKEERELYHSDVKAKSGWNASIRFAEKKAAEKAMAEGIEKGMEKGIKKEKISTARVLKERGMPLQDIANITSLAVNEIELL